jgi:VanZ family protein
MTSPSISERSLLLATAALIIAYTLAPFEFSFSWAELLSRAKVALDITDHGGLLNAVTHFVSFFVLGAVFGLVYHRRLEGRFGRLAVTAALFCAGLELVQLFLEPRHARLTDFLSNYSAFLLGAMVSIRLLRTRGFRVALRGDNHRRQARFQTGVFILAVGLWWLVGFSPVRGALELDWDESYRLVIGNEADESRPWLGEVRYVGIYGRALTADQVRLAYEDLGTEREGAASADMRLLAGYDFSKRATGGVVPAGPLRSGDLVMEIPEIRCWGDGCGGALLEDEVLVKSRGPASEITAAILSSEAFTIEAWVRPLNLDQAGPARMVSLSESHSRRNFTLGQEATDLVFRVRNRVNGVNGANHELRVKGAVQDSLQHWVAVYDHGVSSVFRDGVPAGPVVDLREPGVSLRLGGGTPARVAAAFLLVIALALPAYSIFSFLRLRWTRHLAAALVIFSAAGIPYAAACLLVGGPWRPDFFVWLLVALVTAYPLCLVYAGVLRRTREADRGRRLPVGASLRLESGERR